MPNKLNTANYLARVYWPKNKLNKSSTNNRIFTEFKEQKYNIWCQISFHQCDEKEVRAANDS